VAKKIRLIEEDTETKETTDVNVDVEKLMKYIEAIDWKLWELLKLEREKNK
jgi:hypothetical protein